MKDTYFMIFGVGEGEGLPTT